MLPVFLKSSARLIIVRRWLFAKNIAYNEQPLNLSENQLLTVNERFP
jgi:hypothetical protein